ncbi:unnamed protein product [Gadus morhua 'NCC']
MGFLDMDTYTFSRHFRIPRTRFEVLQRVHDAKLPRTSSFFVEWQEKMGEYRLLGDSAYIGQAFSPLPSPPRRDKGALSDAELRSNTDIVRGRVIVEQAFGRMECK